MISLKNPRCDRLGYRGLGMGLIFRRQTMRWEVGSRLVDSGNQIGSRWYVPYREWMEGSGLSSVWEEALGCLNRNSESMMTRIPWWGWEWSPWSLRQSSSMDAWAFGARLAFTQSLSLYLGERVRSWGYYRNRSPGVWRSGSVYRMLEVFTKDGSHLGERQVREHQARLELRAGAYLDRYIRSLPPDSVKALSRVRVRVRFLPMFNYLSEMKLWMESRDRCVLDDGGESSLYPVRSDDSLIPVLTPKGILSALYRMSLWPSSNVIVGRRVDLVLASSKHRESLREMASKMELVASDPLFGLLHTEVIGDGSHGPISVARLGGYRGYRFSLKGSLDGARRAYRSSVRGGMLPLSTVSVPVRHASSVACTPLGTLGVSVTFVY